MAVSQRAPTFQPDPQQSEAIEHVHGPMLVVAGAGTGKTTVLTRCIASLIAEKHARPDEILALTYTINAAAEMRQRVEAELCGFDLKGLRVCTFHAYCNDLLIRAQRDFRVLDDSQLWIFLRRNIRELRLNYYVRAASVAEFLRDLTDFIRRCHDELVEPDRYAEYVRRIERAELPVPRVAKSKKSEDISEEEALGRCREIAFVFETVERMLRERGLGTFGHQILGAHKLLAEDSTVLQKERERAKFVLVDEFQDANYAQIKVLEKLAGAAQNIFAVGDPDQGIYRFRGASSEAFQLFRKQFPGSRFIALTKNRRSTTPILKCAHEVIRHNPEPLDSDYARTPLVSARDECEAGQRNPVEGVLVTSNFMEAADLVSALLERKRQTRCAWKDFAVLYRIHSHRDELAAELARKNIPFSIEGLDVLDAPEVRDVLACLGALLSDADSAAMFRIAALPQFSVDPQELRAAIKSIPRESNLTLATVLPSVSGGAHVVEAVRRVRQETSGSKAYASLLTLSREFQVVRSPAVEALLRFANEWEKSPITQTGEPGEFLEYLEYFREAKGTIPLPGNEQGNAVKLMTAHSVKGLEFDHVFILRVAKGSFPAYFREPLIEFPDQLRNSGVADTDDKQACEQEERRLFYVAMTRARDTLTIYGQFGRGQTEKTPAGYLRELIKNRELKSYLKQRTCREFQTEIFAAADPSPVSRLGEWIAMPPASDLASTLSASAIQHYETCPLQFKLEREWRIPAEPSGALQYGACMHRVLLTYYDSVRWNRTLSEKELIDRFRLDLETAGFTDHYQQELYERKGIEELRRFIGSAELEKAEVLHTEERFKVKVGPTNLVGRIDRIDRGSGDSVVITDYKTGRPQSQEDADESLQLAIYALATRETWGYRVERLVFHNLDGNSKIGTEGSDFKIEEAKAKVQSIAAKISAGQFAPKPGFHCSWCAYRVLCPKTEKRIPELAKPAAVQN